MLAAAVALALATAAPALAADYTVTGLGDAGGGCTADGQCATIRDALASATDFPGSTIHVPAGTTHLTSALTVSSQVTIVGAGARATIIQGSGGDRVFVVTLAPVSFQSLTMSGGVSPDGGGGGTLLLDNGAAVALDHVRVTGGSAPVGGGIYDNNAAQLTIDRSLIDGNSATNGAGIAATGIATAASSLSRAAAAVDPAVTVRDSTIAGNTTVGGGGGAGIEESGLITQLTRVTIANNTAGDGAGGLVGDGGVSIVASIVAGNTGVGAASNCGPTPPVDQGANVESGIDCQFGRVDDRQGVDPQLGAITDAGGQTDVLPLAPTSPAVDLAGACGPATDQRDVARPQGAACDAGAYEYVPPAPPPAPTPTPTPTPVPTPTPTPTPSPTFDKTVVGRTVDGTIRVRRPGSHTFVLLTATQGIPIGSTVDSRDGEVLLTAINKKGGTPRTARFFDGIFKITQSRTTTDLTLTQALASCRKTTASAAATKKRKPKTRKLWGNGSGSFRTRGQYSAATVRGTEWLVEDSCSGTLTRVKHGVVSVRDNVRHRTILLRSGKHYLARPRRH
jgi:hypothetical protein